MREAETLARATGPRKRPLLQAAVSAVGGEVYKDSLYF